MNNYCCICMENLFIPVQLICFSCFHINIFNCSSLCRTCIKCAHDYLQLNLDVNLRDYYKKCIYCPEIANLHDINIDNAYRKDYSLMNIDVNNNYQCPFCKYFIGTQTMISKHLEKHCIYFPVQCHCLRVFSRNDFTYHIFSCPYYISCIICNDCILKIDYTEHMKCKHNHIICKMCNEFIFIDDMTNHIELSCLYRLIICSYCLQLTSFKNYNNHLSIHMDSLIFEMKKLSNDYKNILSRYRKLQELMNISSPQLQLS